MDNKGKTKEYDEKEMGKPDVKLIIFGDSAVGKSKLVERFLLDDYDKRENSTYALTMYRHTTKINNKSYKVDIWDTAGQECFQTLHPSYYFGAHAAILAFDISRKITYLNLKTWYSEMRENCPDIPCIVVANKIDLDKRVTDKTFKFASQNNLPFYFVSAADGTNVVKIFQEVMALAINYKENPPDSFENELMEFLNEESMFDKDKDEK